ncbi:MAG TPA: hypothetical protein VEU95_03925, partial [Micropepsaceae bacterium]|nr:hypothetical protein [Micropepsaceae bacterium]
GAGRAVRDERRQLRSGQVAELGRSFSEAAYGAECGTIIVRHERNIGWNRSLCSCALSSNKPAPAGRGLVIFSNNEARSAALQADYFSIA